LIRRGGAPSGAAGFIIFWGMGVSTPIDHSRKDQFIMEMSSKFPSYMPVAAGIVSVFMEIVYRHLTLEGLFPANEAFRLR
jgi:hypothetical protein